MTASIISRFFSTIKDSLKIPRKDDPSSDSLASEQKSVLIKIVSIYGAVIVEADSSENCSDVKKKALELFLENEQFPFFSTSSDPSDRLSDRFKLIRIKSESLVEDFESLRDLKIRDNEEFLLLNCRPTSEQLNLYDSSFAGPTENQIHEKTANIKKTASRPPAFDVKAMLLQDDMRKVFVTLAQESAMVLGMTPYADKIIAYYRQRINNYIKHHENAVSVLVRLGFPTDRVKDAMKLKANNSKAALDWLIEHETSSGFKEVCDSETQSKSPRSSFATSARRNSILSTSYEQSSNLIERIDGLLEIVNFYAQKDELVYQDNINEMLFMGYEVDKAQEALRVTRNNVAAAVAFIHGDENPSILELRSGLANSSSIRQSFMSSPHIQSTLGNPRSFALFLSILDNPSQANKWNPFSDVGLLMTHIIITYHEEKHISANNQFNESRLPISALSAPNP